MLTIMRLLIISLICSLLLPVSSLAQDVRLPQVIEKTLDNGLKVLIVEQPNLGALHARILIKNAKPNINFSQLNATLFARTAFRRVLVNKIENSLANSLGSEVTPKQSAQLKPAAVNKSGHKTNMSLSPQVLLENNIITASEHNDAISLNDSENWDIFDTMGVTRRILDISADFYAYSMDFPAHVVTSWCAIEASRLKHLPLSRLSLERNQLIKEIDNKVYPYSIPMAILLNTALPNRPYAVTNNVNKAQLIATDIKTLEHHAELVVSPENIYLVLVGDIKSEVMMPQIEHTFGTLTKKANKQICQLNMETTDTNDAIDLLETTDGRHLFINAVGNARILFGWRVPNINHQDRLVLQTLAKILHDRLNANIVLSRNIGHNITVQMGIPGQQDINLLVIEAEAKDSHSLDELEQAIQYEIMRIKLDLLAEQELYQIQKRMELDEVCIQEDASQLAKILGEACCQGNDWKLAFGALTTNQKPTALDIQKAAQSYLSASKTTIVSLKPSSVSTPTNWIEERIIKILTTILERNLEDKAKIQITLRETLRQLRMLSPVEQRHTLKLLESQANLL